MLKKIRFKIVNTIIILLILLFSLIFICLTIGPTHISFVTTFTTIIRKIPFFKQYISINESPLYIDTILFYVRLPRIITSLLVGASLSIIGSTYQGIMKNSMADPYIIGISSGATLGATISIILNLNNYYLMILSFIGSITTLYIVYNISTKNGMISTYSLLLGGVALSSLFSAITSFLMILNKKNTQMILFWMLGSFSGSSWNSVMIITPPVIICFFFFMFFSRELNILLFGEDTALSLGVDIYNLKKIILIISSITIGSSVAVSGPISFIGLIIPHISRLIFGPDYRYLLPISAFIGSCFTMIADTISRTIASPIEIPIGIITAFFGAPFFIYLLIKKNKEKI